MRPNRMLCSLVLISALLSAVPPTHGASCPWQWFSTCPGFSEPNQLIKLDCFDRFCDDHWYQLDCRSELWIGLISWKVKRCYRACTCIIWM